MQTAWDYTHLASAYLKRPDYAQSVIDALVRDLPPGARACDIGAGTGHLTRRLRAAGLKVTAVEPNDAMRSLGRKHSDAQVQWHEGTGEATGQPDHTFALVTFGSSFNVTDRTAALHECQRILAPGGIFACMWNHRDLDDPIQAHIESIIHAAVPDYDYGTRRADQREFLEASGMFGPVRQVEGQVRHRQAVADIVEAWRSHATLARQAGEAREAIIEDIETYLHGLEGDSIEVPYTTRMWMARLAVRSTGE